MKYIKNPIYFQGNTRRQNYFEGWYFKQVSRESGKSISFIPGISLNPSDPHCFIQVIISPPIETYYFKFPVDQFKTNTKPFKVQIGKSYFTEKEAKISLHNETINLQGHLFYGDFAKTKYSPACPNIMGFFAYIPKMECNHGVLSMDHSVQGQLRFKNQQLNFNNDRGYIEKDWGTSFPEKYIWVQGNHFPNKGDSFMCSVAKIPFMGLKFDGLIANLHHRGTEYRFATYNNSKVEKLKLNEDGISLIVTKSKLKLTVKAKFTVVGSLKAPKRGEMSHTIKEGLGGNLTLKLEEKEETILEMTSPYAGIEVEW